MAKVRKAIARSSAPIRPGLLTWPVFTTGWWHRTRRDSIRPSTHLEVGSVGNASSSAQGNTPASSTSARSDPCELDRRRHELDAHYAALHGNALALHRSGDRALSVGALDGRRRGGWSIRHRRLAPAPVRRGSVRLQLGRDEALAVSRTSSPTHLELPHTGVRLGPSRGRRPPDLPSVTERARNRSRSGARCI